MDHRFPGLRTMIQLTRHRRDYLTAAMFKHCKPLFDKDIYLTCKSERHCDLIDKCCLLDPTGIYNTIGLFLTLKHMYRHPYLKRFNDNAEVFLSHPDYPFKHVRVSSVRMARYHFLVFAAGRRKTHLQRRCCLLRKQ